MSGRGRLIAPAMCSASYSSRGRTSTTWADSFSTRRRSSLRSMTLGIVSIPSYMGNARPALRPRPGKPIKRLIESRMATPRTASPRQDRRTALVLAAYRQIAEQGFEGLRTRDVAAEVGVNIATLHYYFPTKEKLIEAVVAHAMDRFRTTLQAGDGSSNLLRAYLRGVRRL